jgi:hypothetical protein
MSFLTSRRAMPSMPSKNRYRDARAHECSPTLDSTQVPTPRPSARLAASTCWPVCACDASHEPAMIPPVVEPRPMEPLGETGDPTLHGVRDVTGYYIHARDGDIGHVEDFLIGTPDWAIRYLIVDTKNWWPGKHVIVAPQWASGISWSERAVPLK